MMERLNQARELFTLGRHIYHTDEVCLENEPYLLQVPDIIIWILVGMAVVLVILFYFFT